MNNFLIGIDAGTTNVKSVALLADGTELHRGVRSNKVLRPYPEWAEQDMSSAWQRVQETLQEVTTALEDPEQIDAVGVTGQGGGCWLIDSAGIPVGKAILWSDGRASDYVNDWHQSGTADNIFDITGYSVYSGLPLPLLQWLADHEPDRLKAAKTLFFCKDWIKYKLTGKRTTDLSGVSLLNMDISRQEKSIELLEEMGLETYESLIPDPVPATTIIGEITSTAAAETGIPEGTPVISGVMDVVASSFGSGAVNPGESSSLVGTTLQNQIIIDEPCAAPPKNGYTLSIGVGNRWLRAMGAMTGTPNLDWAVNELAPTESFAEIESMIRDIPIGCAGVMYHPYLSGAGEKSPFLQPTARAQFIGLDPEHRRAHLLRAVYEGVALAMRDCYTHIPYDSKRVFISGGGSQSDFWCQMFADCLGIEVIVPKGDEFGAKGIGLLASVAVGHHHDIASAVKETLTVSSVYTPRDIPYQKYTLLYDLYTETYQTMAECWDYRKAILEDLPTE